MDNLAERLDNFIREFDPYEYSNKDWSVEKTERAIKESPEAVINELLDILETEVTK